MSRERNQAHEMRGMIARAFVRSTDDAGETQTANVKVYEGVERSNVEILQPFGIASRPRGGGAMLVVAVGGDQGDLVGLPVGLPEDRLGGLEEGESALYGADGTRVHIKADGSVHVSAKTRLLVEVEGSQFEIDAETFRSKVGGTEMVQTAAGWDFTGGTIKHNGVSIDATHVHGGVVVGADDTDVPSN